MRKHLKKLAMVILPVFMLGMTYSCTPEQTNTAKNVMQQADFYMDMAEALVKVASTQFTDNLKVKTALAATVSALQVARQAMKVAGSGLAKDQEALKSAVVMLVVEVFSLAKAIKDAQSASSSVPSP